MSNYVARKFSSGASKPSRVFLLALCIFGLILLVSCTNANTNGSPGVSCPGDTGSFNNASLAAGTQWTYEIAGFEPGQTSTNISAYREAGTFTVDGNGNITAGIDDFYQQAVGQTSAASAPFTGSYSITPNGTGTMTINFGTNIGSLTWAIAMTGTNSFYIIEADTFANAHGHALKQDTTAFATPSGTFAFRVHALGSVSGSSATVGQFTVSGGNVTSGSADSLVGGALVPTSVTGAFGAPDSTGVGSVTLSYGIGTFSFFYYIIDANTIGLFETDASNLAEGRMETQSAGAFSAAAFAGPYAFGSHGDTTISGANGTNTVGQLVADGIGNITSGTYDFEQDGNGGAVQSLTGTYSVSSNGRALLALSPTGANAVSEIAYLVSSNRAFFLINDSAKTEDGTADLQSVSSFSNTSLNGQYAFVMGGYDTTDFVDRVGPMQADGSGNLKLAEVLNRTGSVTAPGCLTGTYTVGANGRAVMSVSSMSSNLVMYLVGGDRAYMLQGDGGTQIYGGVALTTGGVKDPPGGF